MPRFNAVPKATDRSTPLQIELSTRPAILPLYFRVLTARKKKASASQGDTVLASVSLRGQQVDVERLRAYRDVCGFAAGGQLPATYPFVLAMPLHLKLLVSDAFTFPILGLVHLRNQITQHRPIAPDEALDIRCDLLPPVAVKRGYEFALTTRVSVAGTLVWECESVMLSRARHSGKDKPLQSGLVLLPQDIQGMSGHGGDSWDIPEAAGRNYARVSGDWNPIHLFASSARLFGFSSAIVHGMWTKAACLASLERRSGLPESFRQSVEFKRPVPLPSSVRFQSQAGAGATVFRVADDSGKTQYLNGLLEPL
ncbi:MaoC/PaaZ C-terminal domain-containing protein [Microbulbifer sp. HZ11]|uniref:MaoC family dehydratase n=1 Tax=unclassified Microbulbifer TaxID=2619833 RepID=UPI0009DD25B5|nr:MaoC/PaaZ C-terminal domain-containing protein [Microbulbifer sp. HZ11]